VQEKGIYTALFAELTDVELADIIRSEVYRRQKLGIFYIFDAKPGAQGAFASVLPEKFLLTMNAAEQLRLAAALAALSTAEDVPFDPEDDILSDRTPWRTQ